MRTRQTFPRPGLTAFLVMLATLPAITVHADKQIAAAASKINTDIRDAGVGRVAVLPFMFEASESSGGTDAGSSVPRVSRAAQFHVERFENYLSENAGGDYRVLPSAQLIEVFTRKRLDVSKLRPSATSLNEALAHAAQDVDAVVIGFLSHSTNMIEIANGIQAPNEATDIAWRLLDLRDGTNISAATFDRISTLADAVYNGLSGEFFRWQGSRLKVLIEHETGASSSVPLSPREPEKKFQLRNTGLNPLFNINCPYKVSFDVEGQRRSLMVPVDSHGPMFAMNAPQTALGNDYNGKAFLPIEPGETLKIRLRNTTSQSARVAVFVDGVNILGKQRELPNDSCNAWVVKARKPAILKGYYTNWTTDGQLEPFELGEWKDSVAAGLGLKQSADASRQITIVIFSHGPVARNRLALNPRFQEFAQQHWWDTDRSAFWVNEFNMEIAGAAPQGFGFRGRQAVSQPLKLVDAKAPGVILAAMTVQYGTAAEIAAAERRMKQQEPNLRKFVSARTNDFE